MSTPSDLFPLGAFDHKVTKQNRSGHRDATAILVAYRHGLRASELVALRWDDIDLATGRLHVRRAKSGDASVHPISARESRALRKLLREAPTSCASRPASLITMRSNSERCSSDPITLVWPAASSPAMPTATLSTCRPNTQRTMAWPAS